VAAVTKAKVKVRASIMAVVCYQAAAQFILPNVVTAVNFPRLAALAERAMKINAFASTVPIR
jgi:glutathione S-transferase